jgi:hypothetical protein
VNGLALLVVVALASASTPEKPPATPQQADAALEIHSHGETGFNIRELLIPFLARLDFAEAKRYPVSSGRYAASEFKHANGDRVFVLGAPNCLLVGYFATRHPVSPPLLGPADRATRFSAELKDFLSTLPTPRPTASDTLWSWKTYCHAF